MEGITCEILTCNGKPLTEEINITNATFEYTTKDKKTDFARITIDVNKLQFITGGLFPANALLQIVYGYKDNIMGRTWILKEKTYKYSNSRRELILKLHDATRYLMDTTPSPAPLWTTTKTPEGTPMTASAIIREITALHGFAVDVDETIEVPSKPYEQGLMSNGEFIYFLAQKNLNYKVWCDWNIVGVKTLHFKPASTPATAPLYKYTYDKEVIDIKQAILDFSCTEQYVKKDEVTQTNSASNSEYKNDLAILSLTSEPASEAVLIPNKTPGIPAAIAEAELKKRGTEGKNVVVTSNNKVISSPEVNPSTKQTRMAAELEKEQEGFTDCRMTTFGNAQVVAGGTVEVAGLDIETNGIYVIETVTHNIKPTSYRLEWDLLRNANNDALEAMSQVPNVTQAVDTKVNLDLRSVPVGE